jgi:hypothetical protein
MPIVAIVAIDLLDMAVLLLTLAPSQHHSLVRQEHGRTIPLAAVTVAAHFRASHQRHSGRPIVRTFPRVFPIEFPAAGSSRIMADPIAGARIAPLMRRCGGREHAAPQADLHAGHAGLGHSRYVRKIFQSGVGGDGEGADLSRP